MSHIPTGMTWSNGKRARTSWLKELAQRKMKDTLVGKGLAVEEVDGANAANKERCVPGGYAARSLRTYSSSAATRVQARRHGYRLLTRDDPGAARLGENVLMVRRRSA